MHESELSKAEWASYLKEVKLFQDIHAIPEALSELSKKLRLQHFKPKELIITEGELGSELFLLKEGQATVYKATAEGELYKVAILKAEQHAFFGEGGLLESDARTATIMADTNCTCLVLDHNGLFEFGKAHPQWALPIVIRIAVKVMNHLRKANTDLMLIYHALVSEIRGQ